MHSYILLSGIFVRSILDMKARKYGIPFHGNPGEYNTITDVFGVEVGHTTIVEGEGKLIRGKGPIRTGVTAIIPRGKSSPHTFKPVFGAIHSFNGNGEVTGAHWIEESGLISGPIMITNTHSIGAVHQAVIEYLLEKTDKDENVWSLPVVAETWDGFLNDINGFHVKRQHVFHALDTAQSGEVGEGNVGGGTGMICHRFKGGIGTSSRCITINKQEYKVGVLVQANYGYRHSLTIAGVPVGTFLKDKLPESSDTEQGSIIVVVATDAPLLPYQLKRLTKRVPLGVGRVGGFGGDSSGDIFLAFSTANEVPNMQAAEVSIINHAEYLQNDKLDRIFEAVVDATEEAIINALFSAETMIGRDNHIVYKLPIDKVINLLKTHNRITNTTV